MKCDFIDESLSFRPSVVLHLPHTEGTWKQKFTQYNNWLSRSGAKPIQHYASGIRDNEKYPLSGTQDGDVKTFSKRGWEEN